MVVSSSSTRMAGVRRAPHMDAFVTGFWFYGLSESDSCSWRMPHVSTSMGSLDFGTGAFNSNMIQRQRPIFSLSLRGCFFGVFEVTKSIIPHCQPAGTDDFSNGLRRVGTRAHCSKQFRSDRDLSDAFLALLLYVPSLQDCLYLSLAG
jgi:hypothetical protein